MLQMLSVIVNGHWRPGIGDPNFMGWLITAAYLITSLLCGVCAHRSDRVSILDRSGFYRIFWWGLALIMLIMGINKQLDFQSLLILVIKQMAHEQKWYAKRHIFMVWFAAVIAVFGMGLLIWMGWKLKRQWRQYGLALFGILLLITFVIIRIVPINRLNQFLSLQQGIRMIRSILEISGVALIGISAFLGIVRSKKQAAEISNS
jgi:hypothetical protein